MVYMQSANFDSLKPDNELLASLAGLAEAVLHIDPGSTLTRLRSYAEELTKAIYENELRQEEALRQAITELERQRTRNIELLARKMHE